MDPVKRVRIHENPVSKGSRNPSKGVECCPSEAPGAQAALGSLDLDLSNTYPGCSWTGSGYRAEMAEDTGTKEQLRCSVTLPPFGSSGPEPRRPLRHRGRTGR